MEQNSKIAKKFAHEHTTLVILYVMMNTLRAQYVSHVFQGHFTLNNALKVLAPEN
jgi:hypothetical protein